MSPGVYGARATELLIINVDTNGLTSVRTGPGKAADEAIRKQKIEFDTAEPQPTPSLSPNQNLSPRQNLHSQQSRQPRRRWCPLAQTGTNLAPLGLAALLATGGAVTLVAKRRKN
ncbi:hypothetical protein HMPREF2891_02390 [Actinomyces sp. HMSC065F11]|nr:hypothetical protein HMPREF2891_02390 [Actinomyces sp. HMSC065F11]